MITVDVESFRRARIPAAVEHRRYALHHLERAALAVSLTYRATVERLSFILAGAVIQKQRFERLPWALPDFDTAELEPGAREFVEAWLSGPLPDELRARYDLARLVLGVELHITPPKEALKQLRELRAIEGEARAYASQGAALIQRFERATL